MTKPSRGRPAGFTLVEVLVALVILGFVFWLVFTALSGSFDWLGRADSQQRATTIAEAILARVGHDIALHADRQQGDGGENYRWQLEITPYNANDDPVPERLVAYLVSVTVTWRDIRSTRFVHMTSLRLGPPRSSQ